MTQKVLRVGSSAAVTIPRKVLGELGLAIGDRVNVEVDRELLDWTKRFITKYRLALEALAKK